MEAVAHAGLSGVGRPIWAQFQHWIAVGALLAAFFTSSTHAAIIYTGDGTAGGLVPDFPQIWDPNQTVKAICEAASTADVMWYWDQHGFPGLVKHKNPAKPNDT